METIQGKSGTHPLFYAAAGSVILFSVLGSAAIMGWIPRSGADSGTALTQAPAAAVASAAPAAVAPAAAPQPAPRPAARPVQRTESRPAAREPAAPTVAESRQPQPYEVRHSEEPRTVLAQAQELPPQPAARVAPAVCQECGVIESVNEIEKPGDGSGLGAVAGGVVGAIAGKQVGGGRGRTAMSVLGAVGGAFAGNAIEKNVRKVKSYDITIRFEDGTSRTLSQPTPPVWRTGDRVRFVNGAIQPNA